VAAAAGQLIIPSRTLERGDVDDAWSRCDVVVSGRGDSGGQEHLYRETQGTVAIPLERGRIRLLSATQGPTAVQRITARVLGLLTKTPVRPQTFLRRFSNAASSTRPPPTPSPT
jgi:xanthine dehydrogenase large subunit